jgi:hypothetical protein
MCQPLTRREMLRFTALAAATPVVARYARPARAFAQVESRAVPMHLELVTLTDTSAIITWFTGDPTAPDDYARPAPLPADTVLQLGTSPTALATVVDHDDDTPFHYVEITGLDPGQTYFYVAMSAGKVAAPTTVSGVPSPSGLPGPASTFMFTTPQPPPGRHLFTMAWANDLHIGEMTSGLAAGDLPPGFAADPANPYWRFMTEAAVAESRERGAGLLMLNGDLTSEAEPVEVDTCRALLDGFGTYGRDYFVTRGNHDRAHSGAKWQGCEPAGVPEYNDCLRDAFFGSGPTYFSTDHHGLHLVGLDTNDLTTGTGTMTDEQFAWLEADLAAHASAPSFVFGHHPVTQEASATALPPVVFTLESSDARRLEGVIGEHRVIGVHSAHTHRNKRTAAPDAPGVPFIELGAVKEYPGGYALVRVHEGGYAVNFYKTRSDPSRAWSEMSRGEYLNLYPYYTLGSLADRNMVVEVDLSDLAQAASPSAPGVPSASPGAGQGGGGGRTPSTGAGAGLAVAATATAAAAAALASNARSRPPLDANGGEGAARDAG